MRRSRVLEIRDRDEGGRSRLRHLAAAAMAVVLAGGFAGLAAGPAAAEEDPVGVPAAVTSDIGVAVTPRSCSTDRNGVTFVAFTNLIAGNDYLFDVVGPDFGVGGPFEAGSDTEEREIVGMPPGNYYVYVQESLPPDEVTPPDYDWLAFAVEPCQPALEVAVTQCTTVGGAGSVDVTLSRLVAGVEYTVWITDAGDAGGTPYGDPQVVTGDSFAEASASFTSLPAGRSYTVRVDGAWTAEPYEEPPFIGGGNFVPLTTVDLTASADVALAACPATPTTPAAPPAPAAPASATTLPATGTGGIGAALLAALALTGLGVAAVATARLRTRRD
jgi:hypothetical protein